MSNGVKGGILCALAILLDVGAPLATTCMYFPVWVTRSAEATISGIVVVLGLLSVIPLYRVIKERLRSPSAWLLWLLIFLIFSALAEIVAEVRVISFVGFVSNAVGAVLYKVGKRVKEKTNE